MHSSRKSQVKGLEVKQTTLQNEEIAELKKIRDDLLQKVQGSFKKAQGLCIAPPSYIAKNYLKQNKRPSINREGKSRLKHFITRRIPSLNHCIEGESSANMEGKLDLENPKDLFNQRLSLFKHAIKEAWDFFSDKKELEDLKQMKKRYPRIIEHIKGEISLCLTHVGEIIEDSREKDRVHNGSQIYGRQAEINNESDSDDSEYELVDKSSSEYISPLEQGQWEINLAQEFYGHQEIYNPQISTSGCGEVFELEHKAATTEELDGNNHRVRGLDCLRSLEEEFVKKLQHSIEQEDGRVHKIDNDMLRILRSK